MGLAKTLVKENIYFSMAGMGLQGIVMHVKF